MIQATLKHLPTQKNLRKLLLAVGAICCFTLAEAQAPVKTNPSPVKTTPGRPEKSASTYSTLQDTGKVMDVREKLVDLAMQNPNYEIADRNVRIANDQLKKSKSSWLNNISAQGNLNEFSIHPPVSATGQAVNLYPRYNIGVTIPFDLFSAKSNDIKVARQQLGIAQAQKNERFREIKAQVLTLYEDYLLYKQLSSSSRARLCRTPNPCTSRPKRISSNT